MSVAKDPKTGKWYSKFRYTDWTGKRVQRKNGLHNQTGSPGVGTRISYKSCCLLRYVVRVPGRVVYGRL